MNDPTSLLAQIMADPEGMAEELYASSLEPANTVPVEPFFGLTRLERQSAVWTKIEGHLEGKLQSARELNDTHKSGLETAMIRGKIQVMKEILGLGQDPIPEENPEPPDLDY